MNTEKTKSVLYAYLYTALNFLLSIAFTPMIISAYGKHEYGIYQMVGALVLGLMIMNFGISIIVSRNITRFYITSNTQGIENTLFYSRKIIVRLTYLILLLGIIFVFAIRPLFGKTISTSDSVTIYFIYFSLVLNVIIILWQSFCSGIFIGFERLALPNLMKIVGLIIRMLLIIIFAYIKANIVFIALADIVSALLVLAIDYFKLKPYLSKYKFFLHYEDRELYKSMMMFGIASMIQTLIRQINLSIDKVVIGAIMTPSSVSIYSIALLLITSTVTLTKVFATVFLPDATKIVLTTDTKEELTHLMILPGRLQAFIMFGILFGFILIGESFLSLWVGEDFLPIYTPTIIMLIPISLVNITSTADVILDAKQKKIFRSVILAFSALINLLVTIFLVPIYGYIGAALGTGLSYIIGNLFILNFYYSKYINIDILYVYQKIFKTSLPPAIIAFLLTLPFKKTVYSNRTANLLLVATMFSILYCFLACLFLNSWEKRRIIKKLKKILKRKD